MTYRDPSAYVRMMQLTVLDPELAGSPLPAGALEYVCLDCYHDADDLDGFHVLDEEVEVWPRTCPWCGRYIEQPDRSEANARDARPDCP